jgi:hypothetical protein
MVETVFQLKQSDSRVQTVNTGLCSFTSEIPATRVMETGGSWFKVSMGKKLRRPYLSKINQVWHAPVIPVTWEV